MVVLCHGVFDLVHLGHLRHLKQARKEGDVLIVSITADKFVQKGPDRPVFTDQLRAEMLSELSCVDHVIINRAVSGIDVINRVRPDVYVKGIEYKNAEDDISENIGREQKAVESHGGRIFFTDEVIFSSSNILNRNFNTFSPETKDYLNKLRQNYTAEEIIDEVKRGQNLKVAVVGDTVIDRYTYCTPLGKSAKGSFMTVRKSYVEEYAGGAIAVANHIADYVSEVTLVTGIGVESEGEENYEDFIRGHLAENITPQLFYIENTPTLVKNRYVDPEMNKLFEVYIIDEELLQRHWQDRLARHWIEKNIADFDLVVVPDYGNGFITDEMVKVLCNNSKYLAVNTQLNSGNQGYHAITRYDRADFVSLNEPELRLGCHDPRAPLNNLAINMLAQLDSKVLSVTCGPKGLLTVNQKNVAASLMVPVLATNIVDRVGAGDAFLSLASICHAAGVDSDLASFVGSVAAALDVQIVGNSETVGSISLYKYIVSLLK